MGKILQRKGKKCDLLNWDASFRKEIADAGDRDCVIFDVFKKQRNVGLKSVCMADGAMVHFKIDSKVVGYKVVTTKLDFIQNQAA